MPNLSERRVCARIGAPRAAVRERAVVLRVPVVDEVLAARLQRLISAHPTFGERRLWASVDTPNPANDRQLKTGHGKAAGRGVQ